MPNTQRENTNTIFTSEKIYKLDDMENTLKYFTINDTEYYVSNSATANDTKGYHESDLKTVTHTSDRKGKFIYTSKIILNKKY